MTVAHSPGNSDERRPWAYPDPWAGVKWMPVQPQRAPLGWSAADLIGATSRLVACLLIGGSLFMSAVTVAAVLTGGGAGG